MLEEGFGAALLEYADGPYLTPTMGGEVVELSERM
jgi:hypothetical protein